MEAGAARSCLQWRVQDEPCLVHLHRDQTQLVPFLEEGAIPRLSSSKLATLSETESTFSNGTYLFREGDFGTEMFVILEGQILVSKGAGNEEIHLATLSRGDFLGEMSLLEGLPRDANARAMGTARVLSIGQGGLLMRIRRDPTFALELLTRLSGRIRELNSRVAEFTGAANPPSQPQQ